MVTLQHIFFQVNEISNTLYNVTFFDKSIYLLDT